MKKALGRSAFGWFQRIVKVAGLGGENVRPELIDVDSVIAAPSGYLKGRDQLRLSLKVGWERLAKSSRLPSAFPEQLIKSLFKQCPHFWAQFHHLDSS
ncbi:MAG: hypothetical protein ABSF87_05915 [Xanthobacteraceae bacterium]